MKILDCNYEILNHDIISSEKCCIIDKHGNKYIDFESGVWCTSLGHKNKQVNDAIIKQLNSVAHVGYMCTAEIVDIAAAKVLELFNFNNGKCIFLSSGSEAVEFGVQAAKRIMNKPYFLCLSKYFLSSYGISAAQNSEQWISLDLSNYKGNPNDFLKDVPFENIGAFVFEPGNASGTVKLPPKELIKAIESKIKENNGIIVVDEITTGTGRTGKWFGFEHFDISPDIVSFGKGIGNGYPVSVIAMAKHVSELVEKSALRYAQSHQNDPLGCAVVNEVISIINENNLIKKSAEMGNVLNYELNLLEKKHSCINEVRGIGLMFVVEFQQQYNLKLTQIHKELFDAGYITGLNTNANLLRFYPPLIIEESQIKSMANALDIILSSK